MVGAGWVITGGGVMGMAIGLAWARTRGVSRESMDDEAGQRTGNGTRDGQMG